MPSEAWPVQPLFTRPTCRLLLKFKWSKAHHNLWIGWYRIKYVPRHPRVNVPSSFSIVRQLAYTECPLFLHYSPSFISLRLALSTYHHSVLWINKSSDNIRYNLLRTGSIELTTNKILERGFLDAVRTTSPSFPPCDPFSCLHAKPSPLSPAATRLPYPLPTEPHPTTSRSPQSISGAWTTEERLRVSDFTVSITGPCEAGWGDSGGRVRWKGCVGG